MKKYYYKSGDVCPVRVPCQINSIICEFLCCDPKINPTKHWIKCKKLNKALKLKKITPEDNCWYVVKLKDGYGKRIVSFHNGVFLARYTCSLGVNEFDPSDFTIIKKIKV